jgi:hypothetical protein
MKRTYAWNLSELGIQYRPIDAIINPIDMEGIS